VLSPAHVLTVHVPPEPEVEPPPAPLLPLLLLPPSHDAPPLIVKHTLPASAVDVVEDAAATSPNVPTVVVVPDTVCALTSSE
jgi:hypothetical protein